MMKKLFYLFAGYPRYQKFFEYIHRISLVGMGMGVGGDYSSSGESNVLDFIKNKKNPTSEQPITIFDVGANIGNYTKLILDVFKEKTCLVFTFEPLKDSFEQLSRNLNGHSEISIYHLAMSDTKGEVTIFHNDKNSELSSMYNRRLDHFNKELGSKELVPTQTIDSFCEEKNIPHIGFLKLDIEGHELNCLNGAKRMIDSGKIDFIQFEFGGANIDSRTYFQDFWYLLKDKYRIYRILPRDLYEIKNYREANEVFLTTNYLAERKTQ